MYASSASEGLFPAWHDSFLELLFLSLIFWICCVVDVLFLFLYRMDASVLSPINLYAVMEERLIKRIALSIEEKT